MNATLYDIGRARDILNAWVAEAEGEWTLEIAELWDALDGREAEKVERIALFVRELLASADSIDAHPVVTEAVRLQARAKALRVKADWLKDHHLKQHVERYGKLTKSGLPEIRGVLVTVALQRNAFSVVPVVPMDEPELRNIATFCPQYVRHEEKWSLDKEAIKADHKAGTLPEDIARRFAITQSVSLRIR